MHLFNIFLGALGIASWIVALGGASLFFLKFR